MDDPLLAMVEARLSKLEAAATAAAESAVSIVAIDAIDQHGSEAEGKAEFARRVASMRANGSMKLGEVALGIVIVDPRPGDPAQEERETARLAQRLATIEAAEIRTEGATAAGAGLYDFSDEPAALAKLQEKLEGKTYIEAEPIIRAFEAAQHQSIQPPRGSSVWAAAQARTGFDRKSYQDEFARRRGGGDVA